MRLFTIFVCGAGILAAQEPVRFDHKVRELYFAGMGGDRASLEKAMAITSETLKAEPNHAEALVWHGSGVFFLSGEKFRNGDVPGGMEMFKKGTSMMDRAVELAPRNIGVLIPRGAGYMGASRGMPEQVGRPLLEKGVGDYEKAWEMQKGDLSGFSQHSIGELWFGIADGNARLGKTEQAKEFFTMMKDKLPGTPWAKKAEKWFAEGKLAPADGRCVGCHMGSPKAFQN
jgi:hypothetical protein